MSELLNACLSSKEQVREFMEGAGLLVSGVPGTKAADVVSGGGVVGANAARMAVDVGARVSYLTVHYQDCVICPIFLAQL